MLRAPALRWASGLSILLKSKGGGGRPASGCPSKIPARAAPAACRGRGSSSGGLAPGPRAPRARPRAAAARQPRQRVPDTCALRLRPLRTAPARRARPRRQTGSPRRRYLRVLHQNLRSALDAVPRRRRRCNEAASKPLNRWPPDIARALLDRIVCVCVRSLACGGGVRRRRARHLTSNRSPRENKRGLAGRISSSCVWGLSRASAISSFLRPARCSARALGEI